MKTIMLLITCAFISAASTARAQAGAGMRLGNKFDAYVDSIKNSDYRWKFPIWGKKVTKRGFDLQYPVGIMANGYFGSQKITISDLKVGFNDMEPVPLDFVKFGETKASIQTITMRADLWVFPFVDLYLLGGKTWTETSVALIEPFKFNTDANFDGNTFGIGTTLAGGYHGAVLIVDVNHTWTKIDEIEGAIQTTLFTPRVGYNYVFQNKPWKNLVLWVGAPGVFINRTTEGTIDLSDLAPDGSARPDLEDIRDEVAAWYNALAPAQKAVVKAIAERMLDKLDGLDIKGSTVSYSLVKKPTSNWSMSVGAQYQLNHRWQFRTEVGFLGGRSSLLLSANYRFRW